MKGLFGKLCLLSQSDKLSLYTEMQNKYFTYFPGEKNEVNVVKLHNNIQATAIHKVVSCTKINLATSQEVYTFGHWNGKLW